MLMISSGSSLYTLKSKPLQKVSLTRCHLVSELKIAESILLSNIDTSITSLIQVEAEQQVCTIIYYYYYYYYLANLR